MSDNEDNLDQKGCDHNIDKHCEECNTYCDSCQKWCDHNWDEHCKECGTLWDRNPDCKRCMRLYCITCKRHGHTEQWYCIYHKCPTDECSQYYLVRRLCIYVNICKYPHAIKKSSQMCFTCGKIEEHHNCTALYKCNRGVTCSDVCGCSICSSTTHHSSNWCWLCHQDERYCLPNSWCNKITNKRRQQRYFLKYCPTYNWLQTQNLALWNKQKLDIRLKIVIPISDIVNIIKSYYM